MPRLPRIWTRPKPTIEAMNRAIQGRKLILPDPKLNAIIVGALAKAREKHRIDLHFGAFMGDHFHLNFAPASTLDQANFMRDFTRKLSIEAGVLYRWKGTIFPDRYHAIEVSDEPEAQIQRLVYHLSHGCKEGLVASPFDWPGVNFLDALLTGEPLKGIWIDRTAYNTARRQGKDVSEEDFTEHLELPLEPLPCWRHLDQETRRKYVLEIVRHIEEETERRHADAGTRPVGVKAALDHDPHEPAKHLKKSPKPLFHTFTRKVFWEMREALLFLLAAYRDAADRLKVGELWVRFPENTFPPGMPFVRPAWMYLDSSPTIWEPG